MCSCTIQQGRQKKISEEDKHEYDSLTERVSAALEQALHHSQKQDSMVRRYAPPRQRHRLPQARPSHRLFLYRIRPTPIPVHPTVDVTVDMTVFLSVTVAVNVQGVVNLAAVAASVGLLIVTVTVVFFPQQKKAQSDQRQGDGDLCIFS